MKNQKARPRARRRLLAPRDRKRSSSDARSQGPLGQATQRVPCNRVALTIVLVLLVLAGLPLAVWLDLRNLSERALREQADDLSTMIDSIRNYYSSNVVGRVGATSEFQVFNFEQTNSFPGRIMAR